MEICLPHLDSAPLTISTTVKNLGVMFDASLSMEAQITKVAQQAFYHLRQIKLPAPYLSSDDLATVIHATVTSRLDYCNSLYAGLPSTLTRKLQLIQNAAARVLTNTPWKSHIRLTLQQLHWLPVEFQIRFKVLVLIFKAICGSGPTYLRDRLSLYSPQRTLRSSDANLLEIPIHQAIRLTSTRKKAFLALAPSWWNELPTETRAMTELSQFRRACKTILFHQAF